MSFWWVLFSLKRLFLSCCLALPLLYNMAMTSILGIQIISVSFAFFMLYITFLHFKRSNLSGYEFLFWVLLWSGFVILAIRPGLLDPLLEKLFITRAMDLLMIGAFMILSYLGFQNHIGVRNTQKKLESLIRQLSLKENEPKE